MKILHIINSLATGGAEKLLLEVLPIINEKGIQADILVLNADENPFLKRLTELSCCNIYSLGNYSIYNPINILKIIPYLKKYDIIHVHLFPTQYWVAFAKLISFSNVILIFTEHNTSNRRLVNYFFRKLDKHIYKIYKTVICISVEIKEILIKHTQLSLNRFVVINNGVNLNDINKVTSIRREKINKSIKPTDKILIQVAGFRKQKDQATLIRALNLLPENVKLLLVGDGILMKDCETLALNLNLQNRVLFLGLRMDVPQLLKTSDIVVLSSNYEGLSLSCIEGLASGRPFIASNAPGLKEVVEGAGILFPVGDNQQLANEIMKLFDHPDYYRSVAEACQKRAAEYDIQKMIDLHIQLYEEIIKT